MKPSPAILCLLCLPAASGTLHAAFSVGTPAYTKRVETSLLEEPKPMAKTVARVAYAKRLSIAEVRGNWLRVSEGKNQGWVFSGNLSEQKPDESKGTDGLPVAASQTSASLAARPLAPAASDYADRCGHGQAKDDVKWLEEKADALKEPEVRSWQETHRKGEFQ